MNQKQHSRNENFADWQQRQEQPQTLPSSQQKEFRSPVNRSYKDTLFRMLFQEKEALLSLYNAVGQTNYRDASQLEIVTLENAIYQPERILRLIYALREDAQGFVPVLCQLTLTRIPRQDS